MKPSDGHPDERAALLFAAVLTHTRRRRPLAIESGGGDSGGWRAAGRDREVLARNLAQRRGWQRTS
jgi:hypothetical protein